MHFVTQGCVVDWSKYTKYGASTMQVNGHWYKNRLSSAYKKEEGGRLDADGRFCTVAGCLLDYLRTEKARIKDKHWVPEVTESGMVWKQPLQEQPTWQLKFVAMSGHVF